MKHLAIIAGILLISACGTTTQIIEMQQTTVESSSFCCDGIIIAQPLIIQESTEETIYPY